MTEPTPAPAILARAIAASDGAMEIVEPSVHHGPATIEPGEATS